MSFAYHGNYCGPGWSGGKYQDSIEYGTGPPATDAADETCRVHDGHYWSYKHGKRKRGDLYKDDYRFMTANLFKRPKFSLMGAGVGISSGWYHPEVEKKKMSQNVYLATPYTRGRRPLRSSSLGPRRLSASPLFAYRRAVSVPPSFGGRSRSASLPRTASMRTAPSFTGSRGTVVSRRAGGYGSGSGGSRRVRFKKKKMNRKRKSSKKKASKHSIMSYRKDGAFETTEGGNIVNDIQCVYAGMGTRVDDLLYLFYRAVVKKLFNKAGINVMNWSAPVSGWSLVNYYQVKMTYLFEGFTTINDLTVNSVSTTDFNGLAFRLRNEHLDEFLTDAKIQVLTFSLRQTIQDPATIAAEDWIEISSINADRVGVDMYSTIKMTIQNQTLGDTQSPSTDVVNPNPIVGKVYQKHGTCFQVNNKYDLVATPYVAADTGLIIFPTPSTSMYKKPPQPSFFKGVKNTIPVSIQPGGTATFSMHRVQHWTLSSFFKALGKSFHVGTGEKEDHPIGVCQMFAFEKKLDSREVGQSDVSVASQYTHLQGIKLTMKKITPANQIVTVL